MKAEERLNRILDRREIGGWSDLGDLAREAIALLREFPVPGAENSQEAWVHYINAIREWDENKRRKFLDGEP